MKKFKKIQDHEKCWCGSGKDYIDCHKDYDIKLMKYKNYRCVFPTREMIKNEAQIEGIRKAGVINNGLLDYIEERIKIGTTTEQIDNWTNEYLRQNNAKSADLHYEGYPKSICTSINDVVCHGIPSPDDVLKDGDIVNVDATVEYMGYYADASRMYTIGNASEEAKKLVEICRECLEVGMKAIKPWESTISDIGKAVESCAKENGYSVVHEFCGHGVGLAMHENPYVYHYKPFEATELITPGMVFTIEPMINQGTRYIYIDEKDGWTVRTRDGKLSAQWENTFLVTEEGVEIITK